MIKNLCDMIEIYCGNGHSELVQMYLKSGSDSGKDSFYACPKYYPENRNESEDLIMNTALNDDEYTTYHIHIVKEGETVETICSLYNTNLNFIKNYNDVESLTLGSKIIIPTDDES